jgi:hypothetical protein
MARFWFAEIRLLLRLNVELTLPDFRRTLAAWQKSSRHDSEMGGFWHSENPSGSCPMTKELQSEHKFYYDTSSPVTARMLAESLIGFLFGGICEGWRHSSLSNPTERGCSAPSSETAFC